MKSAKKYEVIAKGALEEVENYYSKPTYTILKKVINLALLPPNYVQEGLHLIEQEVNQKFPEMKQWNRFLTEFREFCMEKLTPNVFSVYDMIERTNDYWTKYNSQFNSKVTKYPNTFKLLSKKTIIFFKTTTKKKLI